MVVQSTYAPNDSHPHLRTLNSCLAPVYSVLGRSVITAEGLPAAEPYGTSLVAGRLSEFHASQCGYCTPGFTVACHAALHNAAAAAADGGAAATAMPATPDDGSLLRALDGNLCRCTGYRPIVAACRSLAAEVTDIEDLCRRRTAGATAAGSISPVAATACGSGTADVTSSGSSGSSGSCGDSSCTEISLGSRQVLKVPRSLEQLVSEAGRLAAAAAGRSTPSWRLVAGHTGHGVFKDWPLEEEVLVAVAEVPELRRLEIMAANDGLVNCEEATSAREVSYHLHIGACTTLERLAAHLAHRAQGVAAEEEVAVAAVAPGGTGADNNSDVAGTAFGVRQWAAETSAHLYRIAGRHVRNSATVGGNLVLARERSLPSDVATLLAAAGSEVELVVVSSDPETHGSVRRADLLEFVTGAAPSLPPGASYILTAVRVPLPPADPRVRFWSHRIAERYSNAAAVANAAVLVRLSAAEEAEGPRPVVEEVRIVVGVRTPGGGASAPGAPHDSLSEHNAAKLKDATVVLLDGWQCLRAKAAEAALRNQAATAATVVAALEALAATDLAEVTAAASATAAAAGDEEKAVAAVTIAQGLVAQGLMACLGLSPTPPAAEIQAAPGVDVIKAAAGVENGDGDGGADCVHGAAKVAVHEGVNGDADGAAEAAVIISANGHGITAHSRPDQQPQQPQQPQCSSMSSPPPRRMPPPPLVEGRQFLTDAVPELLPVTQPVPKLGSKLQASGTALYTEDVPVHRGALYGAFVLSARACGRLAGIDASPAVSLPGVVRFLGASDLAGVGPGGALNACEKPPVGAGAAEKTFLEVGGKCEFAGQLVGVVLADSHVAAQRGAKAVHLMYDTSTDGDAPLLSIADAVRARSFYQLPGLLPSFPSGNTYGDKNSVLSKGGSDVDKVLSTAAAPAAAALTAAALGGGERDESTAIAGVPGSASPPPRPSTLRVVCGRYFTPSQLHFYMETQSAVAWPDEDGCVVVHSSCQGPDFVQGGVSAALQLPLNKVLVRCRRVGGGFGGKLTFARRVAVVAAVAAVATGRQVRISVPRNTDAVMWGGRCETDVSYVAVLDDCPAEDGDPDASSSNVHGQQDQTSSPHQRRAPPRFRALDIHAVMMGGAQKDISFIDAMGMIAAVDSVYDIPAFRLEVALARCNLPPRTAVRGPGEINATMVIEQIMEHVAAELKVDPEALREANFLKAPPPPPPPSPEPDCANDVATAPGQGVAAAAPMEPVVTTALGKTIPLRQYTLPYMWSRLQRVADWERIKAAVESFNATSPWRKRGVAMIPTRRVGGAAQGYTMYRGKKPAYVSLLQDGTVQVACHGVEMGQGLWTKVAQVAALTLSEVLPHSRRPLDISFIRICDNSTELLPHSGVTGASTTSEIACAAVRLACLQLLKNLREFALPKMAGREDFGLRAPLSAFAWGGQSDLPESSRGVAVGPLAPQYHVMGVALGVVELSAFHPTHIKRFLKTFLHLRQVDILTGDRRVLRSDIMFDLGRPVNPAVDLGQVEGAFVQGLGMMLQEEVTYDSTTGALVQNSTWNYKPPSVSCVPQQLNVHMLNDAPLASEGPVSSKACGEPPLLLSAVVLAALQRATAAARTATSTSVGSTSNGGDGSGAGQVMKGSGGGSARSGFVPLLAPATVERVRVMCGREGAAEIIKRNLSNW
ncbi:hypothetical protein VOLCADRAFT_98105 [Volvox carteri f. nagariensis]|uniref:FAD-binding PCMH-type domain-containing protein n=1 Tax=Volvox carteri f. nagariensis TaxID=3068 RepID=D8UEG4_VOLCA|nr:uncharacterized protein VOLCADRAFT_98105 [Volvox carteri f. nagariensis]EFJ41839.1 hypothetical protein VOLCADRAFT_98105 [Volvox carteri f. nagariensis]|eukprot:XP_002957037.1 hypothetical protein VOLCADRAFT_98105 [Volvox carteri f. nagariensis]